MRIDPEPQPPLAASAPTMALELALGGSLSTGVFHGFGAVNSPATGAPELVDDELDAPAVVLLAELELEALVALVAVPELEELAVPVLELVALVVLSDVLPVGLPPELEDPLEELALGPLDDTVVPPVPLWPPWPLEGSGESAHAASASTVAADPAAQRKIRRMSLLPDPPHCRIGERRRASLAASVLW
jgi:hypothetical protein